MIILVYSAPGVAEMCKWVDAQGVTHYAETCPDEVESATVEIQEGPSVEQADEAERIFGQMQQEMESKRESRKQQAEQKTTERLVRGEQAVLARDRCTRALINIRKLSQQEPVYYDEDGNLHDEYSVHSASYEGNRSFIDDAHRQALISSNKKVKAVDCGGSIAEVKQRIKMIAVRSDRELCRNLGQKLDELDKFRAMKSLEELNEYEQQILELCH
jgi:hypothetical protein